MENGASKSEEVIKEYMDEYIRKVCMKHECSPEEAKQFAWVKAAEEYYRETNLKPLNEAKGDLPRTELDIGCKGGC